MSDILTDEQVDGFEELFKPMPERLEHRLIATLRHYKAENERLETKVCELLESMERFGTKYARLRDALERILERAEFADISLEVREEPPNIEWNLHLWNGHATGWNKAADIARQALATEGDVSP